MTTNNGHGPAIELSGPVESVNERGLRLAGQAEWNNFSRYRDVPRPLKGQQVRLIVKDGWIQGLDVLDAPQSPPEARQPSEGAGPGRETVITRLAVLKAAAEYVAARPDLTAKDVLTVAERWESWVLR